MADIAVARGAHTHSIDWSAAVWAGVLAGIVFMMMEMLLMPMFGFAPSMWAPPRMIAAIGVGVVGSLLLYGFVFYLMTPGPWPWFANGRNWVNILTHVVSGAVVAWWYKARAKAAQEHAHAHAHAHQ